MNYFQTSELIHEEVGVRNLIAEITQLIYAATHQDEE